MNNLIYQYWDGPLRPGCEASINNMKQYAARIGADFVFDHNTNFVKNLGKASHYYGAFKPAYDGKADKYDNVLFVDCDVFAVDGLEESIFDAFEGDMGICTEPFQPAQRAKVSGPICKARDEQWAKIVEGTWKVKLPRTADGHLKIYNSGVVVYSKEGLRKIKERFISPKKYIDIMTRGRMRGFYTFDQPYLHAMMVVAEMEYTEMDNNWNSYVHYYYADDNKQELLLNDERTPDTKLVHVQLRGADDWDAKKLWQVTNLPSEEWNAQ